MNSYCRNAKEYLKNIDKIDSKELKDFIDGFNSELTTYSYNGLSSYMLESIEACLNLSKCINYKKGEVVTRWLKSYVLFLGGQYNLSLTSYKKVATIMDSRDFAI